MRTFTRPHRDPVKAAGVLRRGARAFLLAHASGQNPQVPDSIWHGRESWLLDHSKDGWSLSAFAREVIEVLQRQEQEKQEREAQAVPAGPPPLSAAMQRAVDKMREHGALEYWRGGYWTYPGCDTIRMTVQGFKGTQHPVPSWYAGTATVHALLRRDVIEFTQRSESGHPTRAQLRPGP